MHTTISLLETDIQETKKVNEATKGERWTVPKVSRFKVKSFNKYRVRKWSEFQRYFS